MLGFIKKDFLLIKSNLKSMTIIFIVYLVLAIQGAFDLSLILPLFGMILLVSTFNYDELNKWYAYAISLPNGKTNIIKSKYVSSVITLLLTGILGVVISCLSSYFKDSLDIMENIVTMAGTLLGIILVISLLYPLIFKFGAERGRIGIFVFIFGGVVLMSFLSKVLDLTMALSWLKELFNITETHFYIIIPILSIIMLYISYLVSKKIFLEKEF